MKNKKNHQKDVSPKLKDDVGDTMHHGIIKDQKVKYRHMNNWLEEDEEYVAPSYRDDDE